MPTALFISPHLDDVGFSCTRLLGYLAAAGWRCMVATVFTRSVLNPRGFALECQTMKGLAATVDYMQLRREEDQRYVATLNRGLAPQHPIALRHGDLPEAPHRGYESAAMLFGGVHGGDEILPSVKELIDAWIDELSPTLVVLPSGYGHHVDHLQVLAATEHLGLDCELLRYRDTPYVIRHPDAVSPLSMEAGVGVHVMKETDGWFKSVGLEAIGCYQTQLAFQYGGEAAMRESMVRHFEWYWLASAKLTGFTPHHATPHE